MRKGRPPARKSALRAARASLRQTPLRAKPKPPRSPQETRLSKQWHDTVVPAKQRSTHEGHHVVPQEKLKQKYAAAAARGEVDLPAILWDARNGLTVAKQDHARHTNAFRRLPKTVLRKANWEFAADHGFIWYLEKHYR